MEDEIFGRLTVLTDMGDYLTVRCKCGTIKSIPRRQLLNKHGPRSCGCASKEAASATGKKNKTHGFSRARPPEYLAWCNMRNRCTNPNNRVFPHYGGRGISVCKRWDKFEAFFADMGKRPLGRTLERRDVNGDYTPSNCIWATQATQMRNTTRNRTISTPQGDMLMCDAALRYGISRSTIFFRIKRGWSEHDAVTKPARHIKPRSCLERP
jgi:hypothetical protein